MPYKDPQSAAAKASNARRRKKYNSNNRERIYKNSLKYRKEYYQKNKWMWRDKWNYRSSMCRRRKLFGITEDEYNQILKEQNNRCAICKKNVKDLDKALSVDHDHNTNKIRGLLCRKCNLGLGCMEDNIETLINAAMYLKNY